MMVVVDPFEIKKGDQLWVPAVFWFKPFWVFALAPVVRSNRKVLWVVEVFPLERLTDPRLVELYDGVNPVLHTPETRFSGITCLRNYPTFHYRHILE